MFTKTEKTILGALPPKYKYSWIIRCDNCRVGVQAHVPYGTYECQQKMKQKAIRAWNKGVKMTIEEVMAKNSVNPIEDKTPSWETS